MVTYTAIGAFAFLVTRVVLMSVGGVMLSDGGAGRDVLLLEEQLAEAIADRHDPAGPLIGAH